MTIADPQLIRVPGATRYIAVDETLTAETPAPVSPVPLCVDAKGDAVLCDSQIGMWLQDYRAALGSCNADKLAVSLLPATEESK